MDSEIFEKSRKRAGNSESRRPENSPDIERCRKRAFDDRHTGRQDSRREEDDAEEVANKEHPDLKSGGKEIAQRRWMIPDPGAAEEAVRLHCYRA